MSRWTWLYFWSFLWARQRKNEETQWRPTFVRFEKRETSDWRRRLASKFCAWDVRERPQPLPPVWARCVFECERWQDVRVHSCLRHRWRERKRLAGNLRQAEQESRGGRGEARQVPRKLWGGGEWERTQ